MTYRSWEHWRQRVWDGEKSWVEPRTPRPSLAPRGTSRTKVTLSLPDELLAGLDAWVVSLREAMSSAPDPSRGVGRGYVALSRSDLVVSIVEGMLRTGADFRELLPSRVQAQEPGRQRTMTSEAAGQLLADCLTGVINEYREAFRSDEDLATRIDEGGWYGYPTVTRAGRLAGFDSNNR